MFTTEFKLKPKPNLKLFVIQYNLKNLSKVMPLIELNEYKRRIAIVNAANPQIQNGTGVTGAISYGLNSYTKGKDVYEAYKKVRKYYKVYDEHNIFEEEEKYPNPYIDRTAVINDMKIAYDDIKMYYYNHCSAFDPYPKYDYLIHVAGPNISGMNYTNEYMRLIGGTTQLESWKIILKRTLETLMNCVQYLKITDLYLPIISSGLYGNFNEALDVHLNVINNFSNIKVNVYLLHFDKKYVDEIIRVATSKHIQIIK